MSRKGFTLLELLVVIAIVAVIGVSATISFSTIDEDTAKKELQNKYIEIQRAASLYVDLNNNDLEWFIQSKKIDLKIADLKSENYITSNLINPVTNGEINGNYFVRLCVTKDQDNKEFVNSSIIDRTSSGVICIANKDGIEGNCGCL